MQETVDLTTGAGTSITISVPLKITIQIGDAETTSQTASPGHSYLRSLPLGERSLGGESETIEAEALRELSRFGERPYYDEAADTTAKAAYYAEIRQEAPDLYAELSILLRRTHQRQLDYNPSKHLYPWVDLQPNGKILSIYSRREMTAEELIRSDAHTDRQRALLEEVLLSDEFLSRSLEDNESLRKRRHDTVEAQLPYNCEHVVPQSWFGKRNPMRADLHHLFACEPRCNGFRGNTPFYDFENTDRQLRDDCGESLDGGFDPMGGKGAAARATLYFLIRYPGEINASRREYTPDRLAILTRWHEEEPVTLYEKHRNAAIFEKQGNRNPLIDFPEWAQKIRFAEGLG